MLGGGCSWLGGPITFITLAELYGGFMNSFFSGTLKVTFGMVSSSPSSYCSDYRLAFSTSRSPLLVTLRRLNAESVRWLEEKAGSSSLSKTLNTLCCIINSTDALRTAGSASEACFGIFPVESSRKHACSSAVAFWLIDGEMFCEYLFCVPTLASIDYSFFSIIELLDKWPVEMVLTSPWLVSNCLRFT